MKTLNNILNDLRNPKKQLDISYTIGTVTLLIYSKEVFKNNKDIVPFLEKVFNISYLPYVIKSRTLICAKIGRELHIMDKNDIKHINSNLLNYFQLDTFNNKLSPEKKKQHKNANDKLDTWLKGF